MLLSAVRLLTCWGKSRVPLSRTLVGWVQVCAHAPKGCEHKVPFQRGFRKIRGSCAVEKLLAPKRWGLHTYRRAAGLLGVCQSVPAVGGDTLLISLLLGILMSEKSPSPPKPRPVAHYCNERISQTLTQHGHMEIL